MLSKKLSRDFDWIEFFYSQTANKKGIYNQPEDEDYPCIREAIRCLVKRLLQPLRIAYGRPIYISSGYRCPELNRLVGGKPSSPHVKGEAADCYVEGKAEDLLDILKKETFPFDQAILYRKRNFLHLSLKCWGKNRRQIIEYD